MTLSKAGFAGVVFAVLGASSAVHAGGFSRGGVNFDLLYSDNTFDGEIGFRFVTPQRTIDSATRLVNLTGAEPITTTDTDVDGNFVVPKIAAKVGFNDLVDCVGTYSTPFGVDVDNGLNSAVSGNAVSFEIDTEDFGLTCSLKFNLGETPFGQSRLRLIGGASYLEFEGFLSRQTFLDFVGIPSAALPTISPALAGLNPEGLGNFSIEDNSFGFRAGAAFEIPAIKARLSAVYSSAYQLSATGFVDTSGFNTPAALANPVNPIALSTEFPQQIDVEIQSGINEKTLGFARFNWTDWSQLRSIPVMGVFSPLSGLPVDTFFEPIFRDGYTLTGGIGRQLTKNLSSQLSVTWDRGTSTNTGTQTNTWLVATGIQYDFNKNFALQAGGALGILTSGFTPGDEVLDINTAASRSFGNDIVGAFTANLKFSF